MAIFVMAELEGKVQLLDKTRINAKNTFASKGAAAITAMTISPESATTAVSVFDATAANRYLDWTFDNMNYDSFGILFKWKRGGTLYSANVTDGDYNWTDLATALEGEMNTQDSGINYVVEFDDETRKFTISADQTIEIQTSGLAIDMGFDDEIFSGKSIIGNKVDYVKKRVQISATNTDGTETRDFFVKVYDEEGDALFSSDQDLITHEPNILNYLVRGRSSYLDFHRNSQTQIMDWLWNNGISKLGAGGLKKRLKKWDLLDYQDVQTWSTFMTLRLIFQSIRNAKDDVFLEKAKLYEAQEISARQTACMRIDVNADKKADQNEHIHTWSGDIFRR